MRTGTYSNRRTVYRECLMSMNVEDQTEIERAGRRCMVCRTGRQWRDFKVVRANGREPVVMCPACHKRYGEAPPVKVVAQAAPPAPDEATAPVATGNGDQPKQLRPKNGEPKNGEPKKSQAKRSEDRLRRALRELPRGEHSTGRIAKQAGLNHAKTLGRLHQLEAAGEIRQVGKLWSTERPSTDLEGAFDRLQARTSNLRIIRERS